MTKINDLLKIWPARTVATTKFLESNGISRQLTQKYIKTKWLKSIAPGAFIRYGSSISWEGAIYALQHQLSLPVHIGARTALELQGLGHNIRFNQASGIWLFKQAAVTVPSWLRQNFDYILVKQCPVGSLPDLELLKEWFIDFGDGEFTITTSSPELAILECCYLVPDKQGFEECYHIMEGLLTLRPNVVQNLLMHCRSIKAKRLFLFMARSAALPWLKHIDMSKIHLGTGKLQIVKDGVFDSEFLITIPHFLKEGHDNRTDAESLF